MKEGCQENRNRQENHRLRNKRKQKLQTREIFVILLYMQELINRGTYKDDDFDEVISKNMREHGHGWFRPPETWKDDLPILINKYGWRIFETHRAVRTPEGAADGY
jgi:hypothetical protein